MAKQRFVKGRIYKYKPKDAYDEDRPEFDHVIPEWSDDRFLSIVDCWICDRNGNIHPGYNACAVPIFVEHIGHEVWHHDED